MKAKEFANKFGVSVEEMCVITELSRQALYNLRDYAVICRAQDIKKANEDYENRMKMAEIFYVN